MGRTPDGFFPLCERYQLPGLWDTAAVAAQLQGGEGRPSVDCGSEMLGRKELDLKKKNAAEGIERCIRGSGTGYSSKGPGFHS